MRVVDELQREHDDVLVLTTTFPRHPDDTAGQFLLELLAALPHRFTVVHPDHAALGSLPLPGARRAVFPHADVFYGGGAPARLRGGARARLAAAGATLALRRVARREARRTRLIWSHWAVPAGLVGSRARRPHVLSLHGSDVTLLERLPAGAALARRIARGCDRICAPSEALARRFEGLADAPVTLLGCGVHGAPPVERTPGPPRLGLLSRWVPGKGVLEVVRRAGHLPGRLLVVGEGPQRPALERAAASQPRVDLLGPRVGAAKRAFLADLDVFLAPYGEGSGGDPEGLPVSLLEAMAAGRPVVAWRSTAPELLRHGHNALLVPDGKLSPFLDTARALALDAPRAARLGAAAREDTRPYHLDGVAARWRALLDELLTPDRGRPLPPGPRSHPRLRSVASGSPAT